MKNLCETNVLILCVVIKISCEETCCEMPTETFSSLTLSTHVFFPLHSTFVTTTVSGWLAMTRNPIGWIGHSIQPKRKKTDLSEVISNVVVGAYFVLIVSTWSSLVNRPVESVEVDSMRDLVHHFQCFSFFFWFVWAVMQTQWGADWDSENYALSRWTLYKKLKKEYYGVEPLPIL